MASYDSQGVPILGFHNPAATILYPKGLYSYSIGNTRGQDVTENLGTHKEQHLDVLLLASGDVRNVLFTVSGLLFRKPNERPKSISFHLNDYDPSVVARNAVILEIANTINPEVDDDVDFLWNVWYNLALSKDHFDRLRATLASLITRDFDESESILKFQESNVLQECQDIWKNWKELDLDVDSVKEERKQLMREKSEKSSLEQLQQNVVQQILMAPNLSEIIEESSPYYQEIKHWFEEGSTNDERHSVNPTLIRPFVHKWRVHYAACAFEGYLPFPRNDLIRCRSFTGACKETLRWLVKRFQQFKTVRTLTVFSWAGDGLLLCTSGLPEDLRFDIIDTSNVSDHIGLLNVLVCCSPKLKRPLESQMFTSSILWPNGCESMMEYYNKCLGVNTYLLPTILGVKLAVDFDLGSRRLPDELCTTQGIFCWVKTEKTRTLLTLEEGSGVIQALFVLVERCFDLVGLSNDQVFGPNLSSPLTLLRILHQLDPLVEGGAPRILDLLQIKLPSDFQEKFGLSWNLINGSLASIKEPIVEVNVKIDIPCASWFTPIPIIVISPSESAVSPSFFTRRRIIYNSLRYDDSKRVVTFHILEKDWHEIKDTSCLNIVSNTLISTIHCEPVCLGDENVVLSVKRVDPLQTFGLFGVQTFDIRPKKKELSALEVIKVEESECLYKAELAILDPNKCKGKMNVHFYPESCPTDVDVKFEDGEECTTYFSCSVDENSSKFQISRKQGKILCQIPKRGDGTVGESVLQNPAPVPFHALDNWDNGFDDTMIFCGQMFRTELDLKLKSENKSGDAFFNLRESITIFLRGHLDEPGVLKVYALEDNPLAPYCTLEDIKQKKGLIIKVGNVYRWNSLPLIKIIFYDCKRFGDIMRNNPTGPETKLISRSILPEITREFNTRFWADQKELDLLRKILYTNAARVPQDEADSPLWKASFITLLFPRERNNIFFRERAMMKNMAESIIRRFLIQPQRRVSSISAQTQQEAALPGCHFQ